MNRTLIAMALALGLSACSTTIGDLKSSAGATRAFHLEQNYQVVYRRLAQAADCVDGAWAGAFASYQGSHELYPDLGFGEVSVKMTNAGVDNFYWYSEIRREGDGARVEIYAGNTLAATTMARDLESMARGTKTANCA